MRKAFRKKIKRNIPHSSCVHCYTKVFSHEYQRVLNFKCFDQFIEAKLKWKTQVLSKSKKDAFASRQLKFNCRFDKKKRQKLYNNVVYPVKKEKTIFKDLNHNHTVNYCRLILCGDIETNPGPMHLSFVYTTPEGPGKPAGI